jgi:hypothetical protein
MRSGRMGLGASTRNRNIVRVGLDGEGTVIRAQGIAPPGWGRIWWRYPDLS